MAIDFCSTSIKKRLRCLINSQTFYLPSLMIGAIRQCLPSGGRGSNPQCSFRGPNLDRITNDGALFTNAFVPASSCTPCRSSPSKLLASRSKLLPLSDENLQTNRYQTTISVQQVIANLHLLAYILGHYIGHSLPVGYCYLGP